MKIVWKICLVASILFITVFGLYALLDNGIIWFVYPSQEKFPMRGIDVSHHQGEISWATVAEQNIHFVFMKATEGDDFIDKRFAQNWDVARAEGLFVGAYHFYSWRFSGDVQAENFIKTVPRSPGALPPVVDLEFGGNAHLHPTKDTLQKELTVFLEKLEQHYGQKPILYVTREFYEEYHKSMPEGSLLWVRSIFRSPNEHIFPQWTFWQYKNRGHIDGIEGFVDLNVFHDGKNEFLQLMK